MDRVTDDLPTTSLYTTSIYGEYGFTDRLTGIAYVPFFVRSTLNNLVRLDGSSVEGGALNAFGDTNLGLKYALVYGEDAPVAISTTLTLGLPLGNDGGGPSNSLQTGDGEFNQMISIDISRSFYPAPFYATATFALNNRTNGFSDEYRYGFEIGFTSKKINLISRLNAVQSFLNGDAEGSTSSSIFSNNTEFLAVGGELNYNINMSLGFSVGGTIPLSGQQILRAPSYDFGLFMKI